MAEVSEATTTTATDLLAAGRRHLAVRDFFAATEALANACELLAKEHGDSADQCAEAYLWYGKALLGLSREESGVLGDGVPGSGNADEEDDENEEENGENGEDTEMNEASSGEADKKEAEASGEAGKKEEVEEETVEPESTTKEDEPGSSKPEPDSADDDKPGTSNGDANGDESVVNMDNEDDVDNLQLAWEMLDLSRSILRRRGAAARAQLAEVHLALGEVALESETYDKAVLDMQSCLEIQKELYNSDDRRIAETHYQIGLANSLASNFEDAITHFKNAANIIETRIKTLENPSAATEDATVKKYSTADPFYSIEGEIKELKELLPEIQEKIQDMMDYKAETIKRVRETLCPSNGSSSHTNGAGSSSAFSAPSSAFSSASSASSSSKPSDISHLIKRKRKSSESDAAASAPKKMNT